MRNLFIVANWKENKTKEEAKEWMREFHKVYQKRDNVTVIICPSFLSLPTVSDYALSNDLGVEVGAQNISVFNTGAHTGEVSASQVAELARYVIVGHSERRKNGETDEQVSEKINNAILCVQNQNIQVPDGAKIVAYEPIEAIGTGNPDTPENAEKIAKEIKMKNSWVESVLYGGSVTSQNVSTFTNMEEISGVLVGGASLNPNEFSEIIKNA